MCPGCFNPETHAHTERNGASAGELLRWLQEDCRGIEGGSISGGEPMEQAEGLLELLRAVRTQTGLSVLVFSGYTLKQIQLLPLGQDVLGCVDVLIDGAFDESRPVRRGLLGSAHEHVRLLTDRYTEEDMSRVPGAEVVIAPDGSVTVTGISPPSLAR